jgi:hypothetical protein
MDLRNRLEVGEEVVVFDCEVQSRDTVQLITEETYANGSKGYEHARLTGGRVFDLCTSLERKHGRLDRMVWIRPLKRVVREARERRMVDLLLEIARFSTISIESTASTSFRFLKDDELEVAIGLAEKLADTLRR